MPRRPNAILISDSVSVVGMLVLIVGCYHIALARRDVTRSSPADAGRPGRRPHGCDGAAPRKRPPGWAVRILSGIFDPYGYHSGEAQERDARAAARGGSTRACRAGRRARKPR